MTSARNAYIDELYSDGSSTESDVVATIGFQPTDIGNAERFVAQHRAVVRYSPQRRKWMTWGGDRWMWDAEGRVYQFAKETVRSIYTEAGSAPTEERREALAKHAYRSESAQRVAAMVSLAQTEAGIPMKVENLDADPWVLNVSNGTIDLRTGSLREHQPSDYCTKSTLIDYRPDARSDLWDRVLREATAEDAALATYVQRVAGYSLIGAPLERVLFFLYGPPGTAKSTLIEALDGALGSYSMSADFETWLQRQTVGGNRGDLVRLAGARLVTSVEVRKHARWDEALIKRISGGDEITAAAKFESEVTYRPSYTLMLAANDAPKARDDDAGMWARMRRIPLTAVIPPEKQDPSIKTRLREPEHATAILAWAVAGCIDYQRDGFGRCRAVEQSTAAYQQEMDVTATFFSECCIFDEKASVAKREMRSAYEDWCRESGHRNHAGAREFADRITDRGAKDAKSNGIRMWRGVRLLGPDEEPPAGPSGPSGPSIPEESQGSFFSYRDHRENATLSDPCDPVEGGRPTSTAGSPEQSALDEEWRT